MCSIGGKDKGIKDANLIVCDVDKNIKIGNLVVDKREELKEFRDYLMYDRLVGKLATYEVVSDRNLSTFKEVFQSGGFRRDNFFIERKQLGVAYYVPNSNECICEYNEKVIRSLYLNSILIFSSLLGEIDASTISTVAQQFIQAGIYRCESLEDIWKVCSRDILKKGSLNDLLAFRMALGDAIQFDVIDTISLKDNAGYFKNFNIDDLNQVKYNSEILLGDHSFTRKKK